MADYESRYQYLNAEYGKDREKQFRDCIENIQKIIDETAAEIEKKSAD